MPLRCSSGSWSETVLPSSTVPMRVMRAGREQHGFQQRRLARPAVADQQDVADVLRVVGLQRGSFRGVAVRIRVAGSGILELLGSRPSDGPLPAQPPGTALTRAALLIGARARRRRAGGSSSSREPPERGGLRRRRGGAPADRRAPREPRRGRSGRPDARRAARPAVGRGVSWARSRGSRASARPTSASAALVALCASFLSSYVRARGASLGYTVEESHVTRGLRYALVRRPAGRMAGVGRVGGGRDLGPRGRSSGRARSRGRSAT